MISEQTAVEAKGKQSEADPTDRNEPPQPPQESAACNNGERPGLERQKPNYKNIPQEWKAIPPVRFRKVIGHLEAVLLEISTDGTLTSNLFDWKPRIPTLQAWAVHLRSALKELTKA